MECRVFEVCEGNDCVCNVIANIAKLDQCSKGGDRISSRTVNSGDGYIVCEPDDNCAIEGTQIVMIQEGYEKNIC